MIYGYLSVVYACLFAMLKFVEELLQGETVEWKPLGEVAKLKRGTSVTKKTSMVGKYPVVAGGQHPAYYINQFNREGETITIAGSGAYAGFVMYWDEPIFVSDAFSIKADETQLLPRYVYYYLQNIQDSIHELKRGGGVPHVYARDVACFSIPIPPLRIQEKIVEVLDKYTALEEELEAKLKTELSLRKKQYAYYLNKLLTFGDEVEWTRLGEVAKIFSGKNKERSENGKYPVYGSTGIIGCTDYYDYTTEQLLVARVGANAGYVHIASGEYAVSDNT